MECQVKWLKEQIKELKKIREDTQLGKKMTNDKAIRWILDEIIPLFKELQ